MAVYVVGTTSEKKRHTGAKFLIQRGRSMVKLGPASTNPVLTTRPKRLKQTTIANDLSLNVSDIGGRI